MARREELQELDPRKGRPEAAVEGFIYSFILEPILEGFCYGPLLWTPLILVGSVLWAPALYMVCSWYEGP